MSLKEKLKNLIQNNRGKPISMDELLEFTRQENYSVSNAYRRLHDLEKENAEIKVLKNEKRAIVGYLWQEENKTVEQPLFEKQKTFTYG